MSQIQVSHLTFGYEGSYDNVFEDISFGIDTDWKLGFVGRNGRGKTTLFRLLMGEYPYEGRIAASVRFGYFPYPVEDETVMTYEVAAQVCSTAEDWELLRELSLLRVDAEVLYRPFVTLSKGEQTKVLLAALFLNEGDFLLIDEPTNHLDVHARAVVAQYLNTKKGFILISHDRVLLDACTDHTLAINRGGIEVVSGSYSVWKENFDQQNAFELNQNERLKKELSRLKEAATRASAWSARTESEKKGKSNAGSKIDRGFVGHKSAKMMQRAKNLEHRQQAAMEEKANLLKNVETSESLKLHPLKFHVQRLISLKDVGIHYGDRAVCGNLSFEVQQGERICLSGGNGCGKSSTLKLILGEEIPHTGEVLVPNGLKISYVSQDTSQLCGDLSDYAWKMKIDESLFKAILRKLDFSRVQFSKDMTEFSQGQKKKVLLAASLCESAHLYLWDEPLNFVDILSREQIEELLLEYRPTLLFVEHDLAFRQKIATKTVEL